MSQAKGDPEELVRFAGVLSNFIEEMQSAQNSLDSAFTVLGDTWDDSQRRRFEDEYRELTQLLAQFMSNASQESIPHLHSLAARLQEYLQS